MPKLTRKEASEKLRAARIHGGDAHPPSNVAKLPRSADTAVRLITDLKEGLIDALDITRTQRKACLALLAHGSQTTAELAVLFRCSAQTIRGDIKILREEIGREVREWTIEEVIGQAVMAADKCSAMAMRQQDPGLSWTINRDLVKLLVDLGVIEPQGRRDAMTITIESISQGYEKASKVLTTALDPRLTGVECEPEEDEAGLPGLTFDAKVLPAGPVSESETCDVASQPTNGS